ncbi:MAG: NAD(P) transhydrogenase subunit alpha, partial [Streptomyces sp.]|nr:NAD(P) transhydrogenase subunit alpha [Streptomyces sp.]
MASVTVGVCAESAPGEHRVALVPAVVGTLRAMGARVAVEEGAGRPAGFEDGAYARAGAGVASRADVVGQADMLIGVQRPAAATGPGMRRGQVVAGLLRPLRNALTVRYWADHGITAISFDLLTDGPGRPPVAARAGAGAVDAAAEQARITGHQAVLTGLLHCGRSLPGSVTGREDRPARILVV